MDKDGIKEIDRFYLWWMAGRCRECHILLLACQGCGTKVLLKDSENYICSCSHDWLYKEQEIYLKTRIQKDHEMQDTTSRINPEFIEWLLGYPKGWTKVE